MNRPLALLFAKYPRPGFVNTRMVPPLTAEEAAELHHASLLAMYDLAAGLADLETIVVVTPDDHGAQMCNLIADVYSSAEPAVNQDSPRRTITRQSLQAIHSMSGRPHELNPAVQAWPQGDGDLGQRLARASRHAFEEGADRIILLGADSPTVPPAILLKALDSLGANDRPAPDAVLGPTEDGGYYLLGLRRPVPELFDEIDWGGPAVAHQTRERAATSGIHLAELPIWYDLDRFADFARAVADLSLREPMASPAMVRLRSLLTRLVKKYDR